MRHFDVQLIGGMVLHGGSIAEMKTGEGKTLTGTLAVVLNALPGTGVHVVTVNDYLARRDAEWMKPIYDFMGLSLGILQNMQAYEDKRAAYASDITYGTNSEFGFDYLRDNMAISLEEKVQFGGRYDDEGKPHTSHPYAIVDEVDNILIDEARTPLIISGAPEQAADLYAKFAKLAPRLTAGVKPEGMDPKAKKGFVADYDYEFDEKHKTVSVTERGVEKAERFLGIDHLYRAENGNLVNHLHQSLKAESLYKRDVDYAVVDGEVKIIDEFTGRILDGRRWSEGLHQAVEAKEGVRVQEENQTLATITLQNYFRMYSKLAGMTGTALTEATEFMKIYKLVGRPDPDEPPDGPRATRTTRSSRPRTASGARSIREIQARHEARQPVLVGTISVEVSEMLGDQPQELGIPHAVLNAKPEYAELEGETIAEAGRPGAVTIATNMAGRGVDIKLGGNAEHQAGLELAKLGLAAGRPRLRRAPRRRPPRHRGRASSRTARRCSRPAACSSAARSATSRAGSTTSSAAAPAARATRASRASSSRAEDDLVRLFAGDRIYRILDRLGPVVRGGPRGAHRGEDALQADRGRAEEGRGAELPHPQARPRVRRRDEPAARGRLPVPRRGARGPRHGARRARADRRGHRPHGRGVHAGRLPRGVGPRRPVGPARPDLRGRLRARATSTASRSTARSSSGCSPTTRSSSTTSARRSSARSSCARSSATCCSRSSTRSWREHLYDMDYLREGIHLRGFAQIDPLVAYKNEAFTLFRT